MATQATADEILDHLNTVRARLAALQLSRLELREQYEQRQRQIINPDPNDPVVRSADILRAELELIRTMMTERAPAPLTPEEIAQSLEETNPQAAGALAHTLARRQLLAAVAQAQNMVNELAAAGQHSESAVAALARAEQALADLPPAPFVQAHQAAKELRAEAEQLQRQASVALTEEDRTSLEQQATEKLQQARAATAPAPLTIKTTPTDNEPDPLDLIHAGELAAFEAMAQEKAGEGV